MPDNALKPVHFPNVEFGEQVDLSPQIIERVTLVLAGVDPNSLDLSDKGSPSKSRTIQQIRFDGSLKKISPSKGLISDHRFLLWPKYPISESDFDSLWKKSRTVAGGQESTVLVQHVRWLRKLDLNFDSSSIRSGTDQKYLRSTPELAPRILFFLFRTALRRIDRDASNAAPTPPSPSRIGRVLMSFGISTPPPMPHVYFPEAVLTETENYVESSLKLGRVIRLAMKQMRRARAQ